MIGTDHDIEEAKALQERMIQNLKAKADKTRETHPDYVIWAETVIYKLKRLFWEDRSGYKMDEAEWWLKNEKPLSNLPAEVTGKADYFGFQRGLSLEEAADRLINMRIEQLGGFETCYNNTFYNKVRVYANHGRDALVFEFSHDGVKVIRNYGTPSATSETLLRGPVDVSMERWDNNRKRGLDFSRTKTTQLVLKMTPEQEAEEMQKIFERYKHEGLL